MSDSLRPHESQHARPPCPTPTPGVHSDSTSIESVMPSSHLILCRPLLLLPPIPPSIRVFSNESTLRIRWPKYWSFSFSINVPNLKISKKKKKKKRKSHCLGSWNPKTVLTFSQSLALLFPLKSVASLISSRTAEGFPQYRRDTHEKGPLQRAI